MSSLVRAVPVSGHSSLAPIPSPNKPQDPWRWHSADSSSPISSTSDVNLWIKLKMGEQIEYSREFKLLNSKVPHYYSHVEKESFHRTLCMWKTTYIPWFKSLQNHFLATLTWINWLLIIEYSFMDSSCKVPPLYFTKNFDLPTAPPSFLFHQISCTFAAALKIIVLLCYPILAIYVTI